MLFKILAVDGEDILIKSNSNEKSSIGLKGDKGFILNLYRKKLYIVSIQISFKYMNWVDVEGRSIDMGEYDENKTSHDLGKFIVTYQIKEPNQYRLLDIQRRVSDLHLEEDKYILNISENGVVSLFSEDEKIFEAINKILKQFGSEVKG